LKRREICNSARAKEIEISLSISLRAKNGARSYRP
jgi:hypothetical protein